MSNINTKDRRRKVRALRRLHGDDCFWCEISLDFEDDGGWHPTLDHYVPKVKGGNNKIGNLVLACDWCNQKRAHMTPNQFKKWLRDHLVPPEKRRKRRL